MSVNHKRAARIMRENNLLAVQPRAFILTAHSQHKLEVYRNLASGMKLTGINRLCVDLPRRLAKFCLTGCCGCGQAVHLVGEAK